MMLLQPNKIVAFSDLFEAIWGAQPPATARSQVYTCVSQLRRILPADAIVTDRAGYGLSVASEDLDSLVFARLVATARACGDAPAARSAYRQALDLWRGVACAEIDAPAVRLAAGALEEQHTAAVEEWVDLELAAGRHRELLAHLVPLVERFPLRERLRGQLMLALHGAGRTAEALAEYRRARQTLRDELGIDPGADLQAAQLRILGAEPAGEPPPAEALGPVRCLPRTVGDFTGREELVQGLLDQIGDADPAGAAIVAIDGMAGSGKTTLALHLAALAGDRYPDAHLFADLHGHSEQDPEDPSSVLLILLRQLGLRADMIPPDLVGRTGLWRTEVARRRILVVLDNAASSAQLADLLPTSPGSLALVTSRRRLAGLDGVRSHPLPLLAPDEAITLLGRIAGSRVSDEPDAAAQVVRSCGHLPLAVRLAGARLAQRHRWRVADLVTRFSEAVLPELVVENRTVVGAFALSYQALSEPARRLFRLLGVYPGASLAAPAAAALTGLPLRDAEDLLAELLDARLIEEPEAGVYRLHDLIREYAAALPTAEKERAEAVLEVLNLHTHVCAASVTVSYQPYVARDLTSVPVSRPDLVAAVTDPIAWLERHRGDLMAFVDAALRAGHPAYSWWLPRAAWFQLYYQGYHDDVGALCERGFAIAEKHGDDDGMAMMANYVASYYFRISDYDRSLHFLRITLRIRQRQGDPRATSNAHGNLVPIYIASGRLTDAVEAAREANRLAYLGGRRNSHTVMSQLSLAYQRLGRWPEALWVARLVLLSSFQPGDKLVGALLLMEIQRAKRHLGLITPQRAQRYLEIALHMAVRGRIQATAADIRSELGTVLAEQGRFDEALAQHRLALEMGMPTSSPEEKSQHRLAYARTLLRSGDPDAALALFEQSLASGRRWGQRYTIAVAAAALADCVAGSDPDRARRLRQEADVLFEEMGLRHPAGSA
ncbi:AfsR/SARP family transcriptional regulator [Actinoplanes octamycinicus]|uniref:AfsR/SARP family transcriptional regulator n=1 Tax=Actinoplanes octamycinicus TaxID=135948 RepID=UPI0035E6FB80